MGLSGSMGAAKSKFLSVAAKGSLRMAQSLSPRLKSLATDDELDEVEKSFMVNSDNDNDGEAEQRILHITMGGEDCDDDGGSDDSEALMAMRATSDGVEALKGLVKKMTIDGEDMRFDAKWQQRSNRPANVGYVGLGMEEEL